MYPELDVTVEDSALAELVHAWLRDLQPVLIARHGVDVGSDLCGEVAGYAWEHRHRLAAMASPVGFLYRVSQSRARRYWRWRRPMDLPSEPVGAEFTTETESNLHNALARLTADERTVVVLFHSFGYSHSDIADWMGVSSAAVRNRLHRAMKHLRHVLDEEI